MQWLNVELALLRGPELSTATPAELGVWLKLTAYCAANENGGLIAGAATWNDRHWLIRCGVTGKEVAGVTNLLKTEGNDIRVAFYPSEKEEEVKRNRENGKRGGRPKYNQVDNHPVNPPVNSPVNPIDSQPGNHPVQNRYEGIGIGIGIGNTEKAATLPKEGNDAAGSSASPSPAAAAPQEVLPGISGEVQPAKSAVKPAAKRVLIDSDWLADLGLDPAFDGVDIFREHAKCARWCKENKKQLSRRRFINWLNRCEKPLNGANKSEFSGRF
jgi:hypothetical protein